METKEPEELTYTYDGKELKFMSNSFDYPEKLVNRRVHVPAKDAAEPFLLGELMPVFVRESDAGKFDAGCPDGPIVVVAAAHGIAVNVLKGCALPVSGGCRQTYGDDLPVFDRYKLAEQRLHHVFKNRYWNRNH